LEFLFNESFTIKLKVDMSRELLNETYPTSQIMSD